MWYALTLPSEQQVQIDATGSDYEAGLVVLAGTGPEDDLVACGVERLTFTARGGVTYFVQVGAVMGLAGHGWLELTFREAPRTRGKPTTSTARLDAQVALAAWEVELPHGRRLVQVAASSTSEHHIPGAPSTLADLWVEIHRQR